MLDVDREAYEAGHVDQNRGALEEVARLEPRHHLRDLDPHLVRQDEDDGALEEGAPRRVDGRMVAEDADDADIQQVNE